MIDSLDRLLELEFEKWKYYAHLRLKFSEEEEQKYNSLYKTIQGLIEKGKKYEQFEIEEGSDPITVVNALSIKSEQLLDQNKALQAHDNVEVNG